MCCAEIAAPKPRLDRNVRSVVRNCNTIHHSGDGPVDVAGGEMSRRKERVLQKGFQTITPVAYWCSSSPMATRFDSVSMNNTRELSTA